VRKKKLQKSSVIEQVEYLTAASGGEKTIEGEVLDTLGLTQICCRRHLLTHVDIE
jgi:DNA-directed RNA polymerase I, II, and III subunit RPABC5